MSKREIKNNPFQASKPVDAFSMFSDTGVKPEQPATTPVPSSDSVVGDVVSQAKQKQTMADTHTRATFIVENELLERWNALLATQEEKRIKNKVFNRMLREFLDKEEASMNEN